MVALRAKLLMWAQPLSGAGIFAATALDAIRGGAGTKDAAGERVALASWSKRSCVPASPHS